MPTKIAYSRHRRRRLQFEPLETRMLLTPTTATLAHVVATPNIDMISPLATASPTGLSPAQVRAAYGFNSVSFNGIVGTGAGQTIAIVDAYNDPNIVSDL